MSKFFVIVVTYKGHLWYERCFSSLRSSSISVQTVVIDNASNDGTVEYIRENFPEIHLIESKENLGFGKANNVGIRYALDHGCDYVFLLNQDAWVENDTFEKLINIHKRNPEYGILGCINVTKERDHMLDGFVTTISDPRNCDQKLIDDLFFSRLEDVYEVKSILAAAWLMPKNTLEVLGGFDPIFFHYGEDDNYLQRAHYHGIKVGVCPKCLIVHDAQTCRTDKAVEFRKNKYAFQREVLLRWTDINLYSSIQIKIVRLFFKVLKSFLLCRKERMNVLYNEFSFVLKKYSQIQNSIRTNLKSGSHYLS